MTITKIYSPTDNVPVSPEDVVLGRNVLITNMGLKPNESLLIVTDTAMEKAEGACWFAAGKTISLKTQMVVFEGMTENAQEPSEEITQMMLQADVVMLQTTYSLSHTKARKGACANGARVASLPTATMDLIRRTLSIDYEPINRLSNKLVTFLTGKKTATITTQLGTNLTMSIVGMKSEADGGILTKPGSFGNLPAGEAMLAPVEGTTNGVFIIEGAFAAIPTDKPIKVTVKDGLATSITGGKAAVELDTTVNRIGDRARNIAELGIGTNPKADPKGSVLEAEKAYGTVHIALGNNMSYGGSVNVPFHSDGIILSPTLTIDNQVILKNGEFML
jgi:leucyl aminopeptidase (aminopeptidase T)